MRTLKLSIVLISTLFFSTLTFAEAKVITEAIDINKKEQVDWYMHPSLWVVALAIFSMIIIKILCERKKEYL